jgi:glycosyltransferase involved in cell wall biosynthesis
VIVFVNYFFDPADRDPEACLARYWIVRGWAAAVAQAADAPVAVVQRFGRAALVREAGVDFHFVEDAAVPQPPSWWWSLRAVQAAVALAPAVVHLHSLVYPLQVRLLRARLPPAAALLVQDHGGIHAGSPGFRLRRWRALHRFGLRAADGFLFSAEELARPWQEAGIIGPGQAVHAVPEGSTDLALSPPRPADRRASGQPALLWVGRLDDNKDPLTVLSAFERALAHLPAAELTMAFSESSLLPRVRARLAASPALRARVHLAGRIDHAAMPALYASADLFVLGSHHEGSGYALLEALACGLTPVVTDIPSFRVFCGGRVGELFPPGDVAACAAAIVRQGRDVLAHGPARRSDVAAHFARALSWPAVGARAVAIYRAVAQKRVSGAVTPPAPMTSSKT